MFYVCITVGLDGFTPYGQDCFAVAELDGLFSLCDRYAADFCDWFEEFAPRRDGYAVHLAACAVAGNASGLDCILAYTTKAEGPATMLSIRGMTEAEYRREMEGEE